MKNMNKEYDVCIIGAGIAGLLLAWSLGRNGHRVLIVERNETIKMNGADILKPSGIAVLEEMDLLNDLLLEDIRVRNELSVFHNGIQTTHIDYRTEHSRGYFLIAPYAVVLELLIQKLREIDSVRVLLGCRLESVDPQIGGKGKMNLSISTGDTITCTLLVGADGSQSVVRKSAGIEAHIHYYNQVMYFHKYATTASVEELNRLYVDEDRGLAYFYPINRKEARCIVGFEIEEGKALLEKNDAELLKERLRRFVTESDDMLEQINSLKQFATFPLSRMHVRSYFQGNIVLLGNAAHAIHPITGQGMNLTIEDVGALSKHLFGYFDKQCSLTDALTAFQGERYAINGGVIDYGHRLATSFHSPHLFAETINPSIQTSNRDAVISEKIS